MLFSGFDAALDDTVETMRPGIVLANKSWLVVVVTAITASGCTTSSHRVIGKTRTPVPSDEVRIYLEPIAGPFDTIALVDASSRHSWCVTAAGKADVVISRLKAEAARLGANGILLEEISSAGSGQVGAGLAPDISRDHASVGVGLTAAGLMSSRYGRGVAIYVAPDASGRPDPAKHADP